ncbi:hypothetical protein D187_000975 [Cystobacter fuscus DSM 2262]|uniref:Uncharacterized protein n=1 Tax=Cystobacter fuscus (strain ATCC 25194 / DSM 2262 / NBRC 100088 / M29) TaxID=1242864 RepID=S9PFN1_CYSF2|nr:hypothetical protein D187_000975 [Cystobacter fuscus DSM 2262]
MRSHGVLSAERCQRDDNQNTSSVVAESLPEAVPRVLQFGKILRVP